MSAAKGDEAIAMPGLLKPANDLTAAASLNALKSGVRTVHCGLAPCGSCHPRDREAPLFGEAVGSEGISHGWGGTR
ncbi:hypothetical protein CHELA1G11_30131 [Hyphomicrobiales bacterium]|nr:hypothetical protein CHELA1G11_30131 [Hyphomicrobiales bacterium]